MKFKANTDSKWLEESRKILLEELILGRKVDIHTCVITELDYFVERGLTIDRMKSQHLITDFHTLTDLISGINERCSAYEDKKLDKMLKAILIRWKSNTLNNKQLSAEIDKRIADEIVDVWMNSDSPKRSIIPKIIEGIEAHFLKKTAATLQKYLERSYDQSYDFNQLEQCLEQNLLNYYIDQTNKEASSKITLIIDNQKKQLFMSYFKNQKFDPKILQELEDKIKTEWIFASRNRQYPKSVSSFDYYCWELAVALVKDKGKFCTPDMSDFIKQAIDKILEEWRKDTLPSSITQLKDHLEKFLVDFYSERMQEESEVDCLLQVEAIKAIMSAPSNFPSLIEYLKEKAALYINEQLRKTGVLVMQAVLAMLQDAKSNSASQYACEFRSLVDQMGDTIINSGEKSTPVLTYDDRQRAQINDNVKVNDVALASSTLIAK